MYKDYIIASAPCCPPPRLLPQYFRREKAWNILSRDACRDRHKASSCGAVT